MTVSPSLPILTDQWFGWSLIDGCRQSYGYVVMTIVLGIVCLIMRWDLSVLCVAWCPWLAQTLVLRQSIAFAGDGVYGVLSCRIGIPWLQEDRAHSRSRLFDWTEVQTCRRTTYACRPALRITLRAGNCVVIVPAGPASVASERVAGLEQRARLMCVTDPGHQR